MNFKTVLLLVLTVSLGGICIQQTWHSARQTAQVVTLREELEQRTAQVRELTAAKERLQQRNEPFPSAEEQLGSGPPPAAPALSVPQASGGRLKPQASSAELDRKPASGPESTPFGEFFTKIMQDPDTKSYVRDQQRMMLDQLYGPLVKQMGLTPEEANQFKDLLTENTMKATESATALFGGAGQTNRTELFGTLAAESKAREAQIKDFLGDARYAQYQEYQQTAGERMQLNLFRQQNSADGALTDSQTEQLLILMKEEKQKLAGAGQPVAGLEQSGANFQALLSEDHSDQLLANQEGINQRVYERAKDVLLPEQLSQFGKFQSNQIQMLRMGMSMTRKFLAPDKAASGP